MTEYVPVSWSKSPITVEVLQRMASNDEALFELKPTAAIKHSGVSRNRGMKILAGSQLFQPSNEYNATNTIYFGNYFSVGCLPIVQTGLYSHPQTGMNIATFGIGGVKVPDHRGFNAYCWSDDRLGNNGRIVQPYYVTYIAIGF